MSLAWAGNLPILLAMFLRGKETSSFITKGHEGFKRFYYFIYFFVVNKKPCSPREIGKAVISQGKFVVIQI